MALENNPQLGKGGAGMHGTGPGTAAAHIAELQGLRISLITGGAANTKFDIAAIRPEDTIVAAHNNAAGTVTDITANVTIADLRAAGTVAVGTPVLGDTVTIAGLTYTVVAANTVVAPHDFSKVKLGTAAEVAARLLAAVNARENNRTSQVSATLASTTLTVTAVAEGTAGNTIALVEVGTTFTISGVVLTGGSATGGIKSTSVTNQITVFWFNKR